MKNILAASLVGITLACVNPAKGADISKLDARIDAAHECIARVNDHARQGYSL